MVFAAPWMLLGLLALAAPLVIHMLDRSRSVPLDWPCLRFLQAAHQQTSQRTRIKHLLVLLARCLLLTLVVLAMAQPYKQRQSWEKPPDLPTTLVLVLDQSFSMGCRDGTDGGASRFEVAQKLALAQLAKLAIDDEVALVFAADQPVTLTDRPTRDVEHVRQMIQQAAVTNRPADLAAALTSAFTVGQLDSAPAGASEATAAGDDKTLRRRRQAWRQVMVITDMQRSAWQTLLASDLLKQVENPLPVTVLEVGQSRTANRYVRQIDIAGDGASAALVVDVQVAVDRGGSGGGAKATLWLDGQAVGSPELVPARGGRIKLVAPLPAPGLHRGFVQLDEDPLAIDDRRYFCVNVAQRGNVTIVDGSPSEVGRLAETYYLRQALHSSAARGAGVELADLTPEQLSQRGPGGAGCLMLANVPQLDGAALTNVENFLRAGGNVFIAMGDKVAIDHYNKDWRFLPLRLDRVLGGSDHSRAYGIIVDQPTHPIITGDVDLAATRFFQFVGSDPTTLKPGGSIIASFSNGSPALVEALYGDKGRVVLLTGSVGDGWSNLPYRRAFVPLVDRLVGYLTQQRMTTRSVNVGQPLRFTGPPSVQQRVIRVTTPDGKTSTLHPHAEESTGQLVADFADTDKIGIYTVEADRAFGVEGAFAVNVDTGESILAAADVEALRKVFGQVPVRFVAGQGDDLAQWKVSADEEFGRHREAFWGWLLLAALVLLAVETALSNYFTRREKVKVRVATEYLGRAEAAARRAG